MTRSVLFSAAFVLVSLSGPALANPEGAPHAAACVAALKAEEAAIAETLKAGEPVESKLLKVIRSGFAIIGSQYLAGLREAEARRLLEAAEVDFQALPRDTAEAQQARCLEEGDGIYRRASAFERSLITNAAQRRIKRMKAAP